MADLNTLTDSFLATVSRSPSRPALSWKTAGGWRSINYGDYGTRVTRLALALIELGTQFGDRIALLSENRPEWVMADQGILMAGAITVPLYPTLTAAQTAYILNNCGAKLILVSSEAQYQKIVEIRGSVPALQHIVVMSPLQTQAQEQRVYYLDDLLALGERVAHHHEMELQTRRQMLTKESLATIVYTSGTTGEPKGAMLTHGNLMSNVLEVVPIVGIHREDVALSFLPLSHVLERISNFGVVHAGGHVYFAQSVETVADDLLEVRPTMLTSVPRLFEKIRARVFDRMAHESAVKRTIFEWACDVGQAYRKAQMAGAPRPFDLAFKQQIADSLVFSQIRERTGGRLRLCVSGGAPLPADVGLFFGMIGIEIIEGYGLTETSPVVALNRPGQVCYGTVGHPLPGVEVKLAEDGELLVRGPNVMKGYYNNSEATAQAIDSEGFFATGDVAEFDSLGRIRIVDRKKEIIVMSNGKNVAPQPIENALKGSHLIEQAMLVGDQRHYITALIVPNVDALQSFLQEQRLSGQPLEEVLRHPQVEALFAREVDNAGRSFARYEQIKRFSLLPRMFMAEYDELTPTLKLKRRVIQTNFAKQIEEMYQTATVVT
ncbi:MAG: long-chain fatty acid--CoA ligase [Candidatus Sericytochromatia bacterium]|nr:long-chain fatty acid--CoA ligase [Candidatus Sericytochromatia bacterium]